MWQKRHVTYRLEPSYHHSFFTRADTPALAEYCVQEPLILHGHLWMPEYLQLWLADPKEELKQSVIDVWSSPLYLAAPYTLLTVLKRPSWHSSLTISAKSIWIHFFDYHQPGGQRKKQTWECRNHCTYN